MDRVFVTNRSSPKKGFFKQVIGGGGKTKRRHSEATEYFPYAGGDGIDNHEFHPEHLSYEPAESMLDSDVRIDPDNSQTLGKSVRRILLKGSKYEVYNPPPINSATTTDDDDSDGIGQIPPASTYLKESTREKPKETTKSTKEPAKEGTPIDVMPFIGQIPLDLDEAIAKVREISRNSVILYPIDVIPDHVEGLEAPVAAIEVILLMVIADRLAKAVQFLCYPGVFIVTMLTKIF